MTKIIEVISCRTCPHVWLEIDPDGPGNGKWKCGKKEYLYVGEQYYNYKEDVVNPSCPLKNSEDFIALVKEEQLILKLLGDAYNG